MRSKNLLRPEEANITLVNRENYWVYQPMLSEVISGSIGVANVVSPIRRLCPRTNLVMREIEDIDLQNNIVTVSPGFRPRHLELQYDYLVIALGNVTNFYGMPGMIENAMPFRTLADAMVLRNHVIRTLEEADVEDDPELRRKLLTFVVGGGGFSGVEVIAELNDFVRAVKKNYLRLRNEPHRACWFIREIGFCRRWPNHWRCLPRRCCASAALKSFSKTGWWRRRRRRRS